MSDASRQPSLWSNLALSAGVSLLLLLGLEGGARLLARRAPARPVAEYIWDWERMWEGDFYTVGSAATGWPPWEEFNVDGLRDRTHAEQHPPRVWRVAFLGDSVTLGDGIAASEAYPQALQQHLDLAGRQAEVFNVALWGWSTRQQRLAYTRIARRYTPDQVVLAVCLNDLPELQNNLARPPAWLTRAHARSALVRLVVGAQAREIGRVEELFEQPEPRRVREAFTRFFAEVRALRDDVQRDGARFALIVFPFRFQLEPGAPSPHAQHRLLEFCRNESLQCLDLLPSLSALGPAAFRDYDHLSVEGAALVARELAGSPLVAGARSHVPFLEAQRAAGAPERLVTRLTHALTGDADPAARGAAAWALGRQGAAATAALPALFARVRDGSEDPGVRAAAAQSLARVPGDVHASRAALAVGLGAVHQSVRWAAAQAWAALPAAANASELASLRALARPGVDPYVRAFAVWSLGESGPAAAEALPELVLALSDERLGRGSAAQALAKLGVAAGPAVPALTVQLIAGDARRRWNAASALGRTGATGLAAETALVHALVDDDPRVRAQAALALGRLRASSTQALAALGARLRDDEPEVRALAARALGFVGGPARVAVPALNATARDEDARVRREATKALRRIQDGAAMPVGQDDEPVAGARTPAT